MRPIWGSASWIALEALGGAVFSLIGLLVIAWLIGPRNFGLAAIALGIMQTVNFFPDTLFHDAIIQRRRLSRLHLGSAFWSVAALSALLAVAVAATAPVIARLYDDPELALLLLALAASSLPTGIASIQAARLRRAMRFRPLAICTIVSRAIATVAGVALALRHHGAWAAIAQNALTPTILAAQLAVTTRWGFARCFSFAHARDIGVFALTRTLGHFVESTRGRLFIVLLGQYLALPVLGQLSFAFRLVESITTVAATVIGRLYLPIFSRLQGDVRAVAAALEQASCLMAALLLPMFATLAVVGEDMVHVSAGASWQGVGDLLPWLCVAGAAAIVTISFATALLAIGRPALVSIAASSIFAGLFVGILLAAPTTGVQAVRCWMAAMLVGIPVTVALIRRPLRLTVAAQLLSIVPGLLISACVAGATLLVRSHLPRPSLLGLLLALGAAGLTYALLLGLFFFFFFATRQRPWASAVPDLRPSYFGGIR